MVRGLLDVVVEGCQSAHVLGLGVVVVVVVVEGFQSAHVPRLVVWEDDDDDVVVDAVQSSQVVWPVVVWPIGPTFWLVVVTGQKF